ncbi:MAG: hypothetical protein ACREOB_07585, partial [Thermodesulfobacteriota bacterium]
DTPKLKDRNNKREEPQKKDDHAIDSCRYMFSFMPELSKMQTEVDRTVNKRDIAEMMSPGTTFNPNRFKVFPWQIDPEFSRVPVPERGWGEE